MIRRAIPFLITAMFLTILFAGIPTSTSGGPLDITSIEGTVTDMDTGEPIEGVVVYLWESMRRNEPVRTDENG